MATDVVMPQMGESIAEGTIVRWLKKVGDAVEKDEPLFEISTDKVDAEIPSPIAGVLTEIKAAEGETVQINVVVAVIGGASGGTSTGASERISSATVADPASLPVTDTLVARITLQAQSAPTQVVRSSPLVRRIAKEHNFDLRQVRGTGSNGRINKNDIIEFINSGGAKAAIAPKASLAAHQ